MPRTLLLNVRTHVTSVSRGEYTTARLFAGVLVESKSLPCHLLYRERERKEKDAFITT